MKSGIYALLLTGLVSACAATRPPAETKHPVFSMTSIVLYQPNEVLVERLGDASGLASYTQALVAAASDAFANWPKQGPVQGSLVVAVKPSGATRVWPLYFDGSIGDAEGLALKQRLEAVRLELSHRPQPATPS